MSNCPEEAALVVYMVFTPMTGAEIISSSVTSVGAYTHSLCGGTIQYDAFTVNKNAV